MEKDSAPCAVAQRVNQRGCLPSEWLPLRVMFKLVPLSGCKPGISFVPAATYMFVFLAQEFLMSAHHYTSARESNSPPCTGKHVLKGIAYSHKSVFNPTAMLAIPFHVSITTSRLGKVTLSSAVGKLHGPRIERLYLCHEHPDRLLPELTNLLQVLGQQVGRVSSLSHGLCVRKLFTNCINSYCSVSDRDAIACITFTRPVPAAAPACGPCTAWLLETEKRGIPSGFPHSCLLPAALFAALCLQTAVFPGKNGLSYNRRPTSIDLRICDTDDRGQHTPAHLLGRIEGAWQVIRNRAGSAC
jgi:hypothetical protein